MNNNNNNNPKSGMLHRNNSRFARGGYKFFELAEHNTIFLLGRSYALPISIIIHYIPIFSTKDL